MSAPVACFLASKFRRLGNSRRYTLHDVRSIPYPEGNARNAALLKSLNLLRAFSSFSARRRRKVSPRAFTSLCDIYYLLTPESAKGKMHTSFRSEQTFHTLYQGRALCTLVNPLPADAPEGAQPEIKQVVMGADSTKGEVRQLLVEGGWWKASEIPPEDLAAGDQDSIGCLIFGVVTPGFDFEEHKLLSPTDLLELFRGA
ncbi:hypothetical protein JCM11641_007402 [Rhodosporidiobolus odoratus]